MNTIQQIVHRMLQYRLNEVARLISSRPQAMAWFKMVVFSRPYGITDGEFPRETTWPWSFQDRLIKYERTEYYWENRLPGLRN